MSGRSGGPLEDVSLVPSSVLRANRLGPAYRSPEHPSVVVPEIGLDDMAALQSVRHNHFVGVGEAE